MNKELEDVIKAYAARPHSELNNILISKSKDDLIAIINNILTIYFNDRNSSTMREYVTVSLAGYKPSEKKIGYNGFKQDTSVGGKVIACECKPKNVVTSDGKLKKLSGGANFTDYTFGRFKRDKKENVNILMSGFIDGHLIYIIEFPFKCPSFVKQLRKVLKRRFPDGDVSGQYLRSATFRLEDYKNYSGIKLIYLDKTTLEANKKFVTKQLYDFLNDLNHGQK
jgi:hypothetical protein